MQSSPAGSRQSETFHRVKPLLNFSYEELESVLAQDSVEKYRVRQICNWIFSQRIISFEKMSDLPQDLRRILAKKYLLSTLRCVRKERSHFDATVKYTFQTQDQKIFSTVLLTHENYHSLCISSQVGCAWECQFCASGLVPFQRNLSCSEILEQILWAEKESGKKIRNVLFMGMGEPLANYSGTVRAIQWMKSVHGLGMNPKRITLSTTGLAPQIEKIAKEKTNVNLSLSLHAPTDELRKKIMPKSSSFAVKEVLNACKFYQQQNRGDFTIEYILLKNVNDRKEDARKLAELIFSVHFSPLPKINLIPYNPVKSLPYEAPTLQNTKSFFELLKKCGFNVHTRKPQGQDIEAACGQLL